MTSLKIKFQSLCVCNPSAWKVELRTRVYSYPWPHETLSLEDDKPEWEKILANHTLNVSRTKLNLQGNTYIHTYTYTQCINIERYNSVAGHLPSLCKVTGKTLNTAKIIKKQNTLFQINNSMTIQFKNSWVERAGSRLSR